MIGTISVRRAIKDSFSEWRNQPRHYLGRWLISSLICFSGIYALINFLSDAIFVENQVVDSFFQ